MALGEDLSNLPVYSIDVWGNSSISDNAINQYRQPMNPNNYLSANPIKAALTEANWNIAEADMGLLPQNQNFQQASAGAGILRTMNEAIKKATADAAKFQAVWWALGIGALGIIVLKKGRG